MKLADALSLRKQINISLQASTSVTANGNPMQMVDVILPTGQGIDSEVGKLKYLTALSLIDRFRFFNEALADLDGAIQAHNASLSAEVPTYVFCNSYEFVGKQTAGMQTMLLRRKELKGLVTILTSYHDSARAKATTTRKPVQESTYNRLQEARGMAPTAQSDEWWISDNNFDRVEMATQLSFFSDCLREIDSAIQGLNWSTEVDVPNHIKAIYIPRPPSYVAKAVGVHVVPTLAPGP